MSDWRSRVLIRTWRVGEVRRKALCGDCVYPILAEVWEGDSEEIGSIDMDCAGEGSGEDVAERIVACVNACKGVSTAMLTQMGRADSWLAKRIDQDPLFLMTLGSPFEEKP